MPRQLVQVLELDNLRLLEEGFELPELVDVHSFCAKGFLFIIKPEKTQRELLL